MLRAVGQCPQNFRSCAGGFYGECPSTERPSGNGGPALNDACAGGAGRPHSLGAGCASPHCACAAHGLTQGSCNCLRFILSDLECAVAAGPRLADTAPVRAVTLRFPCLFPACASRHGQLCVGDGKPACSCAAGGGVRAARRKRAGRSGIIGDSLQRGSCGADRPPRGPRGWRFPEEPRPRAPRSPPPPC